MGIGFPLEFLRSEDDTEQEDIAQDRQDRYGNVDNRHGNGDY